MYSKTRRPKEMAGAECYNLGKNKMEQQTPMAPSPQIKDEAARRAKTRHFPILNLGEREGLGFPFILSKIVDKRKLKFPSFLFPFNRLPRKLCVCDP